MGRLSVCGVAAALLFTAAGCGSASSGTAGLTTTAAGIVPWTSRPAPSYVAPAKPLPAKTPPTDAPPCRVGDLKVTETFLGGPPGVADYWIKVTNEGRATCIVRGYPRFVTAFAVTGTEQPLQISPGGYVQVEPSDMRPAGSEYMIVSSQLGCNGGASRTYRALRIGWPAGSSVVVRAARGMLFPCSQAGVTMFGVVAPAPVYPPDPLAALRLRLVLPTTVRAGQRMDYVVELVNPTSRAISLRPCPGYLEAMTDLSVPVVKLEYALNCQQASAVPAHGMVRFAMVLAVPATAVPAFSGTVTILWFLLGASLTETHGHVRLAGAAK